MMAKKIKFALEMNGEKIRNLEELKENFDLDTAAQYLLDGKLLTWLEDRFYEDEADQVREIDTNSPSMKQALCNVFGIEYEDDSGMDTEELERLNEKKRVLKSMTDDESIIANAAKTALDQEDLAELLEAGESTIYLCGDSFNIPLKFNSKRYIGILGTPKIKIKASSSNELENHGLNFENVILPFNSSKEEGKSESSPQLPTEDSASIKDELMEIFHDIFGDLPLWEIYGIEHDATMSLLLHLGSGGNRNDFLVDKKLNKTEKRLIMKKLSIEETTEENLIYISALSDFSSAWAFTTDSFHYTHTLWNGLQATYNDNDRIILPNHYHVSKDFNNCIETKRILYKDISNISISSFELIITDKNKLEFKLSSSTDTLMYDNDDNLIKKIAHFLELSSVVSK